ncbi:MULTISPECIES: hypothetical protein [unclassified Flavobacterium]|uniref:hypothetical protein n=1 Tax=unclassified Flavobacterium TaxID=196869 RepID=UPI000868B36E|nr:MULTISPECIES: hypothetical protein [unclassified Flavobacterium]MBN9284129.1 hypothetical protein [Flavobacterium sp.]ODS83597.1 MAG: hypothetical protein ABS44_17230 [Chryseobacterium sp. SCN 40-13]OJV71143.1 MAG: hypothetical protein BGO42_04845 [Flavobacterium sp. 40-81]
MGLFKEKKDVEKVSVPFNGFNKVYGYVQAKWVEGMKIATAEMSKKNWLVLLVVFVLLGTAYNFCVVLQALKGKQSPSPIMQIAPIKKPANISNTGEPMRPATAKKDYLKLLDSVQKIEKQLNSQLKSNNYGKKDD